MSIRRTPDGKWLLDFYPEGKPKGKPSKRIRKTFSTKGEALAYQNHVIENLHNKPWLDGKEDRRMLRQLVYMWFDEHGMTLDDREKRISGEISRTARVKQVSPRTMNLELAYFLSVFNELRRLGHLKHENPLEAMRPFKAEENEMSFLMKEQIDLLLQECQNSRSKCLYDVVRICLAASARAEYLRRAHVTPYRITFMNGNRNRTAPISQALYESLPQTNDALLPPCYSAFHKAMQRTGIELSDDQLSHILLHTFASHFMINGGNILMLQRILGHTDIKMTMRYSHFSLVHLEDALKYNSLEN
ncbi:integrase [Pectobacterium carotovorum subsp. carotovorum]|uniref:phage integrase n=1 Tax=Pectobacterium TaxID=122277 RepID=UPI00027E0821|nr:tyrosine-type recombinase/integrase [Pectobacterium carotovorum]AFR01973.1 integrase family protein [Pectobacterium carotovorum subsp. carotovorum PCC21]GKV97296.1 integrase [Pectobacterium carotovorum subsp. carotovorum]